MIFHFFKWIPTPNGQPLTGPPAVVRPPPLPERAFPIHSRSYGFSEVLNF